MVEVVHKGANGSKGLRKIRRSKVAVGREITPEHLEAIALRRKNELYRRERSGDPNGKSDPQYAGVWGGPRKGGGRKWRWNGGK